jgi:hypothetical protein
VVAAPFDDEDQRGEGDHEQGDGRDYDRVHRNIHR